MQKDTDEYKQAHIIIIHPYEYIHTCIFIPVHLTICIYIMINILSFIHFKYLISI